VALWYLQFIDTSDIVIKSYTIWVYGMLFFKLFRWTALAVMTVLHGTEWHSKLYDHVALPLNIFQTLALLEVSNIDFRSVY
jgi:hypothetical protein